MIRHRARNSKTNKRQSKERGMVAWAFFVTGIPLFILFSSLAWAQDETEELSSAPVNAPSAEPISAPAGMSKVPGEMDGIEEIFAVGDAPAEPVNKGPVIDDREILKAVAPKEGAEFKGVSDLANLAPFKDVAILEKRFLPKTKRFELFGGLNGILNDKFFTAVGLNGRLNYSFTERYAVELVGMIIATGEKSVTRDLREKRGVLTTNFVSPQNYYGVDFKWTPLYGKMTFLNKRITPFDLYFSSGLGITNTNQGGSEPTIHFGTGQTFAFTKSFAFRWDFSWNFYNAKSGVAGAQQNGLYNNLFLTLGASFFFPEATYR